MIFDLIMAAAGAANLTAPTFVGAEFAALSSGAGSVSIPKPVGVAQGDIMIAFLQHSVNCSWSPPSGWTEIVDVGSAPSLCIAYKIATATEGSSYTFSNNFITGDRSGHILAYRGGAFDVVGSVSTTADPIVAPSISVSSGNSILLAMYASSTASRLASSPPSGMTALVQDSNATAPSSAIFSQVVQAGATGSRSAPGMGPAPCSGVLLSIKPA